MLQISAQQLAELLNGIARAQAAVVQGLEVGTPGTRSNYVVPAIQNAAHLRDHPEPSLTDLPVRMLLSHMGRVGPDTAVVARDLERLFSGAGAGAVPAATAAAPVTSGGAAPAGDLDFGLTPSSGA
jgi:hypothetical protein